MFCCNGWSIVCNNSISIVLVTNVLSLNIAQRKTKVKRGILKCEGLNIELYC